MKYLLIPLAFVSASAFACPGDSTKDAMAPSAAKPAVAAKAQPASKANTAAVNSKAVAQVSTKAAFEPRKAAQ